MCWDVLLAGELPVTEAIAAPGDGSEPFFLRRPRHGDARDEQGHLRQYRSRPPEYGDRNQASRSHGGKRRQRPADHRPRRILFWQSGVLIVATFDLVVTVLFYTFYLDDTTTKTATYPDFRALVSNRPYRKLILAGLFLGAAIFSPTGYTVLYIEELVSRSVAFGGVVLALLQVFGSAGRIVTGWLSDVLPGEPQTRIGTILLGQALTSAALFIGASTTSTPLAAVIVFSTLRFFVLGFTGIYYSCMATLIEAEEIGGATASGQLALTTGGLFALLAFGYLADTISYAVSW